MASEKKMIILVPSFHPPQPSNFLKASSIERISHILELGKRKTHNSEFNTRVFRRGSGQEIDTPPLVKEVEAKVRRSFNVFGGEMTYDPPSLPSHHSLHSHHSLPSHPSDHSPKKCKINNDNKRNENKKPVSDSENKLASVQSNSKSAKQQSPSPLKSLAASKILSADAGAGAFSNSLHKRKKTGPSTSAPPPTEARKKQAASTAATTTTLNSHDFPITITGIDIFCRNAGASPEAIEAFKTMCVASEALAVAFIYTDGTTSHAETSVRFCVPSRPCRQWNCVCERHVRARQGESVPLLGAAICIHEQEDCLYFLSLTDSLDALMNFSTTVEQRWEALFDIISSDECRVDEDGVDEEEREERGNTSNKSKISCKVFFNLQVALMPLLQRLRSSSQCYPGLSDNSSRMFDVKIACHLLDPDLSDEELELRASADRQRVAPSHENDEVVTRHKEMGSVTKVLNKLHGELQCLLKLFFILEKDLRSKSLLNCFYQIEMPIAKQLSCMEFRGVRVIPESDFDMLQNKLRQHVTILEDKACRLLEAEEAAQKKVLEYPKPFNLASPEQVAHVLFGVLGLTAPSSSGPASSTKKGRHQSTSEEDLLRVQLAHPLVSVILDHRHVSKILHTFVEGLRPYILETAQRPASLLLPSSTMAAERRVHATWNQTSTRTGRLSCQKPNLQAFPNPKRLHSSLENDNVNTNVRAMFTASAGGVLVSADYSQIEMRILAHMCGDIEMISLFNQTEGDIYQTLARIILNKNSFDEVSGEDRERAKTICLGTLYGMGLPAAAARLQISLQLANTIMTSFFLKFKRVKEWIQFIKSDAKAKGFVVTITGRRRFLPDINSSDNKKRSQAERQAVNSVIQGSASDVIKYAMLCVENSIDRHAIFGVASGKQSVASEKFCGINVMRPCIVSQIHDEVIYDIPLLPGARPSEQDTHVHQFIELLRNCLERMTRVGLGIKVPLVANVSIGENWGNMVPCSATVSSTHGKMESSNSCERRDNTTTSCQLQIRAIEQRQKRHCDAMEFTRANDSRSIHITGETNPAFPIKGQQRPDLGSQQLVTCDKVAPVSISEGRSEVMYYDGIDHFILCGDISPNSIRQTRSNNGSPSLCGTSLSSATFNTSSSLLKSVPNQSSPATTGSSNLQQQYQPYSPRFQRSID